MQIVSLSSSSRYGNAYVVMEDGKRPLLIDCGLSLKRLVGGLHRIGFCPEDVAGVFITHEHIDHVRAMCLKTPFPQKYQVPVFAPAGFWEWFYAGRCGYIDPSLIHCLGDAQRTRVAGYDIHAFSKPHDAREPVGYRVDGVSSNAGFVMDLGRFPQKAEKVLRGLEYLVFEANHDEQMELDSGRPSYLIRRVMGGLGHLSNDESAEALTKLVTPQTKQVILAHLSLDCNCPQIAVKTIGDHLAKLGHKPSIIAAPAKGTALFGCGQIC